MLFVFVMGLGVSVRSEFLGHAYVRAVCLVHRDSQNEDQQKALVAVVMVSLVVSEDGVCVCDTYPVVCR